jgi:DNA-directed RNA polymerase specialized sigma subunit
VQCQKQNQVKEQKNGSIENHIALRGVIPVQQTERVMTENDKKKKYLRGYRKHSTRIKRIEAEIEEIRIMKRNPSISNDGMPKGMNTSDLSEYAAELDELEQQLYQEGVKQVKVYKDISWKIQNLKNEEERDVLFYRYIKGMEFWEIAKQMEYSERQVHRIHGRALVNIELNEKK